MPTSRDVLASEFEHPPAEYGPIDGWWWEAGRLDKDRMRWQLEELKDKGVAGTWFYPRYILGEPLSSDPAYFTDEWWEFVRFATEEHKRLGLTSWFSNWDALEFTKERVRAERDRDPSFSGRRLTLHQLDCEADGSAAIELEPEDEVVDAAAYRVEGGRLDYSSRVELSDSIRDRKLDWSAPGGGWRVTVLVAQPWDLNYVNRAVADKWSDTFVGEYARQLPEHVGDPLEAFGVDELTLLDGVTLFSDSVVDRIEAERGYDPRPHLIGLFHDIGSKTDQIRCDYYDAVSALLQENFHRPATEWLEERGMKHATLSQLGPEDLLEQVSQYGDFFRYLSTFGAPGTEDPFRSDAGERRLVQSKLSSSVAHMYGRSRVVVLAHYASGWGVTLQETLAWTNENYAHGLNLYSRTLAMYSLLGGWYEYVPPGDHFYHPYWRYWRRFADYLTRLSYILSQGKHVADVALLYPITTLHANRVAGRESETAPESFDLTPTHEDSFDPAAKECADGLKDLAREIYHAGIDFDFVDYASLERATVDAGVMDVAGVEVRSVVLPPMTTIRRATMDKIKELYDAGGTVVAMGRLPTASMEGGRDDPELAAVVEAIFGPGGDGRAIFVPEDAARVPQILSAAIERDVVSSGPGILHTHQRVDDVDAYFLFNAGETVSKLGPVSFFEDEALHSARRTLDDAHEGERDVAVRLRVDADVERWDPFTGERYPVHRVEHRDGATEVRLRIGPYEGVVLVCSPRSSRPEVVEDDLAEVVEVEASDDNKTLTVHGLAGTGGSKHARVVHDGREYSAEAHVDPPPEPIDLDGEFRFSLEPTMDNRWGDYRHPPAAEKIGAEARRFRYHEERDAPGTQLGLHLPDFADSDWPTVTYSYGPYWWHLGPTREGVDPDGLLEAAKRGDVRPWHRWRSGDAWLNWEPYTFSKRFGPEQLVQPGLPEELRHLLGVPENFLVIDRESPSDDGPRYHYFQTTVHAPAAGDYQLCLGRRKDHDVISGLPTDPTPYTVPDGTAAWVNGAEVLLASGEQGPELRAQVGLANGPNSVLLRLAHSEGRQLEASYVALLQGEPADRDPYVPQLSWFSAPQTLVYDVEPDTDRHVGWFRFEAPPGVREMRVRSNARSIEAWVDGEPVAVDDGTISLGTPRRTVSRVALRLEQQRGSYGGAAFAEPVALECDEGEIRLGDWTNAGLATYSGIGVYSKDVTLSESSTCAIE